MVLFWFFSCSSNCQRTQKCGDKSQTFYFFPINYLLPFFPLFILSSERNSYSIPEVTGISEGAPLDNLV